jgi:hypothetical protein
LTEQTTLRYKVHMTDHSALPAGDEPLSAAAALEILTNQQRSMNNQRGSFAWAISASWGVAWLLGFLALWLIDGLRPGFGISLAAGITIFIALLAAAMVVSAVQGIRGGRGYRGASGAFTGAVYGISWSVATIALAVFGAALLHNGMSPQLANIFYPSAYTFVAGLLYLIAGGIWRSVPSVVVGGWIILVAVIAPWFGYPTHYLVFAIAGGGAFLALSLFEALRSRRLRRSVAESANRAVPTRG